MGGKAEPEADAPQNIVMCLVVIPAPLSDPEAKMSHSSCKFGKFGMAVVYIVFRQLSSKRSK